VGGRGGEGQTDQRVGKFAHIELLLKRFFVVLKERFVDAPKIRVRGYSNSS
jgi:hypothetical protein